MALDASDDDFRRGADLAGLEALEPFPPRRRDPCRDLSIWFQQFEQRNGLFTIAYPDNWRTYGTESGYAVSMAPPGGVVETANGRQAMLYGVIVNHYAPFDGDTDRRIGSTAKSYAPFEDTTRWRGSLEDATDDLVRQLIRSNPYLQARDGQARQALVDGASSYSVVLTGHSPVTGGDERVTVVTRGLSDRHVIYALSIVPGNGSDAMDATFTRMLRSMTVNDDAAHRFERLGSRPGR